jgi:hypothetical protein
VCVCVCCVPLSSLRLRVMLSCQVSCVSFVLFCCCSHTFYFRLS